MKPLQHVHYIRIPDLEGFEVCQVRDSNHSFPNHFHDDVYAIGLMEQGFSYCLELEGHVLKYHFSEKLYFKK